MGCVRAKIGLTGQLDRRKPGNYFKPCVHTFQREMCHDDTFRLLFKTLLKELFTNKGEILSCKSVKPCKNRKNSQEYNTRTRDKSGSNSPPFKGNVQIPPSRAQCTVKCLVCLVHYSPLLDIQLQMLFRPT